MVTGRKLTYRRAEGNFGPYHLFSTFGRHRRSTQSPGGGGSSLRRFVVIAEALVGPNKTAFNFAITIYAGSKSEIAMLLTGPITRALTGSIGNAGGNFGNKITVDVPPEIQQPIKGLYADITAVSATIGKAK